MANVIYNYHIGEKIFTFYCESGDTTSGFYHRVTTFHDYERFEAKVNYYNRTWERFTYESAILRVIESMLKDAREKCYENAREELGKRKLSKSDKETFEAKDESIKELVALHDRVYKGEIPVFDCGDYFRSVYKAC